jgi:ABC-type multidrug transport system fused ATPase/permease subunit
MTVEEAERRSGWRTIRKVAPYLWPEDKPWVKRRVVMALAFLAVAKLVTIGTPFLYKAAVDALAGESAGRSGLAGGMGAVGITVAYGVARAASVGFQQLRDAVFARVAQRRAEASWRWRRSSISTRSACATTSRARPAGSAGSSNAA